MKRMSTPLTNEVAEEIARLENAILAEEQVLTNLEAFAMRVEKAVTATGQRIAQFEQQLEAVKATVAAARAAGGDDLRPSEPRRMCLRRRSRQTPTNASGGTPCPADAAAQLEKVADATRPR